MKIIKERPSGFIFECPFKHTRVRAHIHDIEGFRVTCRACGRSMIPVQTVKQAMALEQAVHRLEAVAVTD